MYRDELQFRTLSARTGRVGDITDFLERFFNDFQARSLLPLSTSLLILFSDSFNVSFPTNSGTFFPITHHVFHSALLASLSYTLLTMYKQLNV